GLLKYTVWIVAALSIIPAYAQSTFGEIRGVVTDPTGAVIVGGSVTSTNTGTGDVRKVVTDNSGNYAILNIEAGTYDVLIEHTAFLKTLAKGVALRAREVVRVDAHLELADTALEVMVTGVPEVITTDLATIVDSKS